MKFWLLLPMQVVLGMIFWSFQIPASVFLSLIGSVEDLFGIESKLDVLVFKTRISYTRGDDASPYPSELDDRY